MRIRLRFWPVAALLFLAFAPESKANEIVQAELRVTGDDGLTQRFVQLLRASLAKSEVLRVSTGSRSRDALVLIVPGNLYWQEVRGEINFQYVVIFTDMSSKYLGASISACWEREIGECATDVVDAAEQAWRNRQSR